jgi:tetratricopeptide (TPR) repeat protein
MRTLIYAMLLIVQFGMTPFVSANDAAGPNWPTDERLVQIDDAIRNGRFVQADAMLVPIENDGTGHMESERLFVRAKYHAALGNLEAATATLKQIDLMKIDRCEGDSLTGWIATEQGQWNKAILKLASALEWCGDDAVLWNMLGLALSAKREYPAALEAFDTALLLKPSHPALLNNRALALIGSNQFDAALMALDQAIAAQPENREIQNNLDYLAGMAGHPLQRRTSDNDTIWAIRLARAGDGARAGAKEARATAYFANAAILLDRYDAHIWQQGELDRQTTGE